MILSLYSTKTGRVIYSRQLVLADYLEPSLWLAIIEGNVYGTHISEWADDINLRISTEACS